MAIAYNPGAYFALPVKVTDAATVNFDYASSNYFYGLTLAGNRTATLNTTTTNTIGVSGPEGTQTPPHGYQIQIEVTQDGTGSRTLTFPSGTLFAGGAGSGVAPLSIAASAKDIVTLFYNSILGAWEGAVQKAYA